MTLWQEMLYVHPSDIIVWMKLHYSAALVGMNFHLFLNLKHGERYILQLMLV